MSKPKKDSFLLVLLLSVILIIILGFGGVFALRNKPLKEIETEKIEYQENSNLPDNLPKDFPVYSNSHITSSWTSDEEDSLGVSIIWETEEDSKIIEQFYNKSLNENGWKITATSTSSNATIYSFQKGQIDGFVGITTTEMTKISVTLGIKK